jgi:hypothetical protein
MRKPAYAESSLRFLDHFRGTMCTFNQNATPHLSSSPRELHQPCLHRRGERQGEG